MFFAGVLFVPLSRRLVDMGQRGDQSQLLLDITVVVPWFSHVETWRKLHCHTSRT